MCTCLTTSAGDVDGSDRPAVTCPPRGATDPVARKRLDFQMAGDH
jgi:hypothetical protein